MDLAQEKMRQSRLSGGDYAIGKMLFFADLADCASASTRMTELAENEARWLGDIGRITSPIEVLYQDTDLGKCVVARFSIVEAA